MKFSLIVKSLTGQEKEFNFDLDFPVSTEIIIDQSILKFGNLKKTKTEIFEIADFRFTDYSISSKEIFKIYNEKPLDCDYNCDECFQKCVKCNSNKFPKNGYCEPIFVSVRSDYLRLEKKFRSLLRRSLDHRLDSDKYAVVTWFWQDNLGKTFI